MNYQDFLNNKTQSATASGFEPVWMPPFLFDFQRELCSWAIRKGRATIFADTGLGKTAMQLTWAENVCRKTGGKVLILAPLAVSGQTAREAEKFGIDCLASRDGKPHPRITVTNYEKIHFFDPDDYAGVVCDESSCLKAFSGVRRKQVTRFLNKTKYRLLCTATAAPNDFIELGTASEALGELSQSDMLGMFFKSCDNMRDSLFKEGDFWNRAKWFFRPHAETPFWRWVCSWARAIRKPSDLGFDDAKFVLPPLTVSQTVVKTTFRFPGELFVRVAGTLKEQREERRRTMQERCEKVAHLVDHDKPALVWCQYNQEGDILEKMIPGAVQVAGCDSDDDKEKRLLDFASGNLRVLVTKPKIASLGLNFQNCAHQTFFPSHSFEQFYQATRRSWRFGQKMPVQIDVIATEGEAGVTENLQKKQRKADQMFANLVLHMREEMGVKTENKHTQPLELPQW